MAEPDLTKLRQEIDRLDAILTETLEKRMDVVQQVAAYKDARNMQVLDREREEQVIAKVVGMLKNPAYAPHMKQTYWQRILNRKSKTPTRSVSGIRE